MTRVYQNLAVYPVTGYTGTRQIQNQHEGWNNHRHECPKKLTIMAFSEPQPSKIVRNATEVGAYL
ncbi:hypothetical protein [Microcoleus sp. FACHB-672]|uniref:hypothetical protein n=1 Tax=Microcoleus sp. FACHB-672 TaxID=2692825 RepID=UPI001684B1A2|nr:hypothetical protein [Microcoleus sp. FACHB-672]MBD2041799.1 hypothetical protein [Microcoleus sp. FACHB-672]